MGTIQRFWGSRTIPNPTGIPEVDYRRYTFGQMKPLPVSPFEITITNDPQTFINVFIPANYWADKKKLIIDIGWTSVIEARSGGPLFQLRQLWQVNDLDALSFALGATIDGSEKIASRSLQWTMVRKDVDIYIYPNPLNDTESTIPDFPVGFGYFWLNEGVGDIDFTEDINLKIILQNDETEGDDIFTPWYAKAFLESALNIRRFT